MHLTSTLREVVHMVQYRLVRYTVRVQSRLSILPSVRPRVVMVGAAGLVDGTQRYTTVKRAGHTTLGGQDA